MIKIIKKVKAEMITVEYDGSSPDGVVDLYDFLDAEYNSNWTQFGDSIHYDEKHIVTIVAPVTTPGTVTDDQTKHTHDD